MNSHSNIHAVGAGGTGAFLIQLLAKTVKGLTIWDGDTYESKNLDRQLVSRDEIGKLKAEVWGERFNQKWVGEYFSSQDVGRGPLIFCAADNHPARLNCLLAADTYRGSAIICGNEYTDAEAYYYTYTMQGSKTDPRVYYPELLNDTHGDPLSPCTGDALEESPQLAISNSLAASYAMWLYWFWVEESLKVSDSNLYPIKVSGSKSRIRTTTVGDMNVA